MAGTTLTQPLHEIFAEPDEIIAADPGRNRTGSSACATCTVHQGWAVAFPPFLNPRHLLLRARVRTPTLIGARAVVGEELEVRRDGQHVGVVVLIQTHDGHLHRGSCHHGRQGVVVGLDRLHDFTERG